MPCRPVSTIQSANLPLTQTSEGREPRKGVCSNHHQFNLWIRTASPQTAGAAHCYTHKVPQVKRGSS